MTVQQIDGDAVDLIARSRIETHEKAGNRRSAYALDDLKAERIGAAAEAAFAMRYDLPSPSDNLISGDNGFDYSIQYDSNAQNVEIKASEYSSPSLMLSDEYQHNKADRYVLATVDWPNKVIFHGWIHSRRIDSVATREPSKFGGYMSVVDKGSLVELPSKDKIKIKNSQ
jgi:hypothetical protein